MSQKSPKCPQCGSSGNDLKLIGKDEGSGIFLSSRPTSTVYAYKCKCGMAFTYTVRNEPAPTTKRG